MNLLFWAIAALVVSIVAGGLGFSGLAAGAATLAKILFGVFLVIAALLFGLILLGIWAGTAVAT